MTRNKEPLYWSTNKEWFVKDETAKYGVQIKDDAPERAKRSFEMWISNGRMTKEQKIFAEKLKIEVYNTVAEKNGWENGNI